MTPDKARRNAAKALLRIFADDVASPFSQEERALHAMDAICYYVSVVYQLPIPKTAPTLMCAGDAPTVLDQVRTVVDKDVTDPADWYKIILKIRELVGVTR